MGVEFFTVFHLCNETINQRRLLQSSRGESVELFYGR